MRFFQSLSFNLAVTLCGLFLGVATPLLAEEGDGPGIRAGAAQRDVTPPVGYEITHYERNSVGVHDPLFVRCLYLEDAEGNHVAMVCTDFIGASFETCDQLRDEIRKKTGVDNALIACSHSHSSVWLGPRGRPTSPTDLDGKWNQRAHDAIIAIVKEAKQKAELVTLRVGREKAQVGFNRRVTHLPSGNVFMAVNRKGPVVPWVNVLVADSKKTGKPLAVMFEHAAHPVIVPHRSGLTSADYPGAAVKRIREKLGEDVIAMFGQGCGGNINGFPLRSTHEKSDQAGHRLGEAVLKAIERAETIKSQTIEITSAQSFLPSRALPTEEAWKKMAEKSKDNPRQMRQLNKIRKFMDRGAMPLPRRFDAYGVMLGREWCLVTMPWEMFCQYELWVDEKAPFKRTMTFAYTNGGRGYIGVDSAWKKGPLGGYEAGSLPNWQASGSTSEYFGPPAVGSEKIIKDTVRSLWQSKQKEK